MAGTAFLAQNVDDIMNRIIKMADISDELILNAIEIDSDIAAAQNHRDRLSSDGMEIVQLDPVDSSRQARVEYYFAGLKHLSDIISMVQEKIEKLLPKLPV